MNLILIIIFTLILIYGFLKRKEYVLATILVGQPILKLFIKPYQNYTNENIALIIYFVIGFFALLIVRLNNKTPIEIGHYSKKMNLLILLFSTMLCFSLIYTPDKIYGLNKSMEFLTTTFLILLVTILTIDSKESLYKCMNAIGNLSLIIGLITVTLIYIKTGDLTARLGTTQAYDIKLFDINFAVSIWFGRRVGIGLLAMLFSLQINKNVINVIKTCILFFMLLLSFSRGPIYSMVFTLVLMIFFSLYNNRTISKKILRRTLIISMIFLVVIMFSISSGKYISSRLITFNDTNTLSRINLYIISMNLIKQNLFGYGIGSFYYFSKGLQPYPHNIILEILLEDGIQAFLIFAILLYLCCMYYFQTLKTKKIIYNPYINFAFSVLLFALINSLFSGDIISNEYIWFGMILISRVMDFIKNNEKQFLKGISHNL